MNGSCADMPVDSSLNQIDLEYLMNPVQYKKYLNKYDETVVNKEDVKFYRRRIIQLTRDLIAEKKFHSNLQACFNNYVVECIKHLKFMDKKDFIQGEYVSVTTNKKISRPFQTQEEKLEDVNGLMMNNSQTKGPTLENFITVKKTHLEPEERIIPIQKNINLRDPQLRKKGVRKKSKLGLKSNDIL